jgi:hypothetical protein
VKNVWHKLSSFYDKNFLLIEFLLAPVLTVLVVLTLHELDKIDAVKESLKENYQVLYGTCAAVTGSLLGFALTAVSVILAFSTMGRFRLLRESKHYSTVFRIYFQTIFWLAVATVWAFIGLVGQSAHSPRLWILYGMLWLGILCIFRMWRCLWILSEFAEIAVKPRS